MLTYLSLAAIAGLNFTVGDLKEHGDWVVGCDNYGSCHATSFPEERTEAGDDVPLGDGGLSLSVKIGPAVGDKPSVSFRLISDRYGQHIPRPVGITVDGKPVGTGLRGVVGNLHLGPDDSGSLIAAVPGAARIALVDSEGGEVASASLRGLSDALGYIDDQQYRAGSTGALVKRGDRPWIDTGSFIHAPRELSIPRRLPQLPVILAPKTKRPPKVLKLHILSKLQAADPCRKYSEGAVAEPPSYHRLDKTSTLMILPTSCGGYNPFRQLFVISEAGQAKPARFWPYPGNDMKEDPGLSDAAWDESARTLSSFGRGRALADCGKAADFVWMKGKFQLVHFKSMYPCRGSQDYITTYRRNVIGTGEPKAED